MNILLVDDEDDALTSLLLLLRPKGYGLFTSRNGIEALEILKNKPVDLIITDILMPVMDGFELCRQMKSDTSLREIPLIFHTATYIDKRDKALAAELGVAAYLQKPAEPEVLYKTIDDALTAVPQLPVAPLEDQAGIIEQHRNILAFKLEDKIRELEIEKKALRTQMRKNTLILNSAGEGILGLDTAGNHTFVNPAAAKMLGYSPEELIGQPSHATWHYSHLDGSDYSEHDCPIYSTLTNRRIFSGEEWFIHKNGSFFPVKYNSSPIIEEGECLGVVVSFSDISEQKQAEEKIIHLAYYDSLTNLPNRVLLMDRLSQLLTIRSHHQQSALVLINIDRFKNINDARGQTFGNILLQATATLLLKLVRDGDTLARMAADEFALLLPNLGSQAEMCGRDAHIVAEKILTHMEQPIIINNEKISITASIGISLFNKKIKGGTDEILRRAATALHRVKDKGGNQCSFYETDMSEIVEQRFLIEKELHEAIANDELRLFLQPQVDSKLQLFGFESMVRWQHPERGLISPGIFIPIAEESDLIIELGEWVLQKALSLSAKGDMAGHPFRLSVNLSPRHFRKKNFIPWLKKIFNSTGADPNHLTLEVTESLLIDNIHEIIAKMNELSSMGIHFSIDDFGTGYSSLAYLKRLPIHELKIDRSFIQDAPLNTGDAALVETILSVAKHMGLNVVAEGVETEEQASFLKQRAKVIYQGYLYGKPEPAEVWFKHWFDDDFT